MGSDFWAFQRKVFIKSFRNDNHLKNHFFSRLRMAIRHLNKHAVKIMGKKARVVKDQVLYKIISICD